MQIQERFGDLPASALAGLGLDVYRLIPDYRDRCPLCDGDGCAVRHGLYHREAVNADGSVERLPIPRFRCRSRGPGTPVARTFSVLPTCLLPRRRYSRPLMRRILELVETRPSIGSVLDELALGGAEPLVLESTVVYRLLRLFVPLERSTLPDRDFSGGDVKSARPGGDSWTKLVQTPVRGSGC